MKRVAIIFLLLGFVSCATLQTKRDDLYMARMFRKNGDNVRSAIFYMRVLKKNPKSIEALSFLYRFYLSQGERMRAFEFLLRLSSIQPEKPLWHFEIGKMLIKDRDKSEGCEEIKKGIECERKLNTSQTTSGLSSDYKQYLEVCGQWKD